MFDYMIVRLEKQIMTGKGKTLARTYKNLNNILHWHTESEIIFVSQGIVKIELNSHDFWLNSGMCAFFKSGDIHCIKGRPDSITHGIKTSEKNISNIIGNSTLKTPVFECTSNLKNLFFEIEKELKIKKEYHEIVADNLAVCLIAEIFRTHEKCLENENATPNEDCKKLLMWIFENHTHISFEDCAKYMNFSKPHFSKYFQKLTGLKFTHYLNLLKITSAVERIMSGEKNITKLSIECGFNTIRNFNRVFKNLTGYAPKSLPKDYNFSYIIPDEKDSGFDPTLNCSQII